MYTPSTFNAMSIDQMPEIIRHLREGRKIEAIKAFRTYYPSGLKEAKDACECIGSALGLGQGHQYAVMHRFPGEGDFVHTNCTSREDAHTFAQGIVNSRDETLVVQVLSRSVVTRAMKPV